MPTALADPSVRPLQLTLSIDIDAIIKASGSSTTTEIVVSHKNKSETVTV